MNLHELINLPHGEANKKIKEAGKWDESRGGEDGEVAWIVTVNVSYTESDTLRIKVFAKDEDHAKTQAEDRAALAYDDIEYAYAGKVERV